MDETTTQTTEAEVTETNTEEPTPTRLQVFVSKHPKASKIAAITGAVGTALGVACFARTVSSNREHLELAGDHTKEALEELSATMDPATADQEA